jgi:hypothetical protein
MKKTFDIVANNFIVVLLVKQGGYFGLPFHAIVYWHKLTAEGLYLTII